MQPFFFNNAHATGSSAGARPRGCRCATTRARTPTRPPRSRADSDVAVVFVADTATEGTDKPCMGLNCGSTDGVDRDALIERWPGGEPAHGRGAGDRPRPVLTPWRDGVAGVRRGVVPGRRRRQGHHARAVRRREPVRAAAGHLPPARERRALRGRPRGLPGRARAGDLQGGRLRRLPLVRRGGLRARLPVRPRAVVHPLPLLRPARREPGRRLRERDRASDQHRPPRRHRDASAVPGDARPLGRRAPAAAGAARVLAAVAPPRPDQDRPLPAQRARPQLLGRRLERLAGGTRLLRGDGRARPRATSGCAT